MNKRKRPGRAKGPVTVELTPRQPLQVDMPYRAPKRFKQIAPKDSRLRDYLARTPQMVLAAGGDGEPCLFTEDEWDALDD